jgi:hypothetical protein
MFQVHFSKKLLKKNEEEIEEKRATLPFINRVIVLTVKTASFISTKMLISFPG